MNYKKSPSQKFARILWDYLRLGLPIHKADGILIFCSNDLRVAVYAASLYHRGYGSWICPSGGVGRLTYDLYHKPEAEAFADILYEAGVPKNAVYIENRATNTAENIFLTRKVLQQNNLDPKELIVLQKPYMERRTYAALTRYWPDMSVYVSSPSISFDDYPFEGFTMNDLIHVMVGDFQRIILYAERGWQTPQPVPPEVLTAFENLVAAGYTRELANPQAPPSLP